MDCYCWLNAVGGDVDDAAGRDVAASDPSQYSRTPTLSTKWTRPRKNPKKGVASWPRAAVAYQANLQRPFPWQRLRHCDLHPWSSRRVAAAAVVVVVG